jgi:hypothetical protein
MHPFLIFKEEKVSLAILHAGPQRAAALRLAVRCFYIMPETVSN